MATQKYETVTLGKFDHGVFIVGQCPGSQRSKDKNFKVFHGNRTGDFVEEVLQGKSNIYLTNAFNYYVWQEDDLKPYVETGYVELKADVDRLKPRKIVCLGTAAHKQVARLKLGIPVITIKHPSYILRFSGDKSDYKKKFLDAIK